MTGRPFAVIAAVDRELGIGKGGGVPWRVPADMRFFRAMTRTTRDPKAKNAVVMGRVTWLSLAPRFRPLPRRLNVVLSRGLDQDPGLAVASGVVEGVAVARDLDSALESLDADPTVERVFVIGGSEVYRSALAHPRCGDLYLTHIDGAFDCDRRFPGLDERAYELAGELERGLGYRIEHWRQAVSARGTAAAIRGASPRRRERDRQARPG